MVLSFALQIFSVFGGRVRKVDHYDKIVRSNKILIGLFDNTMQKKKPKRDW